MNRMEPFRVGIRVLVALGVLAVFVRMAGKRTVGQATAFDFVLALMLGDLFDDLMFAEVPMSQGVVAVGTLVLAHVAVTALGQSGLLAALGMPESPTVLIRNGRSEMSALRSEVVSESDLASLLRRRGVTDRRDVGVARLEDQGELSIVRRPEAERVRRRDRDLVRRIISWRV